MTRFAALILSLNVSTYASELPSRVTFEGAFVNQVTLAADGGRIGVYSSGSQKTELILITHGRRDLVASAAESAAERILAGERTVAYLTESAAFWEDWWDTRFDYYKQQVTQRPSSEPEGLESFPEEGLNWKDLDIRAIATPGYTVDGVTYLVEIEGKKIAFCGDLLLAEGKVRDLFSFQNEIREAKIGGYHGHLGRLHVWLKSLEALAAEKPDILIPARGEPSFSPLEDIDRASRLAKEIYRLYLKTNALHWYFGEERMNKCASLVLGEGETAERMPDAEHIDLPDWCQHIGTTKLLVSESGRGFVLDVGGAKALESLRQFVADGLVKGIDGIFATHTHNDHTAAIAEAAGEFGCPVYALPEVADILENPGNWFLPGISANAVPEVLEKADGETMKWEEFAFTYRFYPGQMYNHGALLVEKADHDPVFFIGDSFSPSGIDDYCLMNRNLMRDDTGYALCFQILEGLPESTWLVNQHIPHLFRFSDSEKEFLKSNYAKRKELISQFVATDDLNYGIDEQWASFYPYGQEVTGQSEAKFEVRIWNHSTVERTYAVTLRDAGGYEVAHGKTKIPARTKTAVPFTVETPNGAGIHVITADIKRGDGYEARGFCETILHVK